MILKEYQKNAVKDLLSATIKSINNSTKSNSIVFKAPTGSGKTVMMQSFLKDFTDNELSQEFCFIWISVNDLSRQSKASFEKNLEGTKLHFSQLSDIEDKELRKNEILFINWESIRSVDKSTGEWKVLAMKDNERDENLPTYLKNTHNSERKIILIVDESHKSLETEKAQDLIQNFIKPILQIEVSATPDSKNYSQKIEVDISDVIKEGMIKKEVLINECLKEKADFEKETDNLILDATFRKQKELIQAYKEINVNVKPLILIQLPSESKSTTEIDKTKMERVVNLLRNEYEITLENQKLAIWLSNDKTNKDLIDIKDSPVEVLIFKQAIATGWDCSRAQILVMFREIKSVTFEIQTVGRILRMPEQKHYENNLLNKAYIYTDLPKAEIGIGETAKNLIKNNIGRRNPILYKEFSLESFYKQRGDYKDIGMGFYKILAKTIVEKVGGIYENHIQMDNLVKLSKFIDTSDKEIKNSILSDGRILVDIDNHTGEKIIAESSFETKTEEEIIKLTFDDFAKNEVGPQFTNIARSYKKIVEGLYFTLDEYFFGRFKRKSYYQRLILNNKDFFMEVLKEAKDNYKDIRSEEIRIKKEEGFKNYSWKIPIEQGFTENAKIIDYKKHILSPSFLNLDSKQEEIFIEEFLEKSENVDFWYKNGTASEQFFAIPYKDEFGEMQSFYPDFIVYFRSGIIGIFDPKSGITLNSQDGKLKAKGLEEYIKQNTKNGKKIIGGIIKIQEFDNKEFTKFYINKFWNYSDSLKDFDIFNDKYINEYSFENITGISDKYISELKLEKEKLEKDILIKRNNYEVFISEQKDSGNFDVSKANDLKREISELEGMINNIGKFSIL